MVKQVICVLFAASLLIFLPVAASGNLSDNPETWCEDENFYEIIAAMEAAGIYAHFLEENSQRYEDYHAEYPDIAFDRVIAFVNVNVDKENYSDIQPVPDPEKITLLVNKQFSLPVDWSPSDLVSIDNDVNVREEVAFYFELMKTTMSEEGLSIYAINAYRSYSAQKDVYDRGVERWFGAPDIADQQYARAGHSEHQAGLAIDVLQSQGLPSMWDAAFEETSQYEWLKENAHRYGFIFRYPRGYSQYTGYNIEPWHWRYIGVEAATRMYEMNMMPFEEYYGRFLVPGVLENVRAYIQEQQELFRATQAEAEPEPPRVTTETPPPAAPNSDVEPEPAAADRTLSRILIIMGILVVGIPAVIIITKVINKRKA